MQARDGPLSAGSAPLVSKGYHLPVPHVLHVTGPQMRRGDRPSELAQQQLTSCYQGCLQAASEHQLRSVAFNCISTGLFGYPQLDAAELALKTVKQWVEEHPGMIDLVVFDVFTEEDHRIYCELAPQVL
eukprot:TRINITY_DN3345_c0_g1_i2.p1 TRINITY_DN3345_c0_g1~~TRINITY_DN3345_c0_g1_i2.p1  ORF type:complete len:129 (-),score=31.71 TRINITY_DN3345_c0_g1_i2:131-517(-)